MDRYRSGRNGASVLAVVIVLAVIITIAVFSYHFLWRGSSRTLFSVQEHRELINLARSSLAEAYFRLQVDLDQSKQKWFDWCTLAIAPSKVFVPQRTRDNATKAMSSSQTVKYTTGDVTMDRVVGLSRLSRGTDMGIVDLRVTVKVQRTAPRHEAQLTLVERRNFWLADNLGPFGGGGRHVEVSPTPAMTMIEE